MKFRFTPEDFKFLLILQPSGQKVVLEGFGYDGYPGMQSLYVVLAEQAAVQANALLEAEEQKCERVYSKLIISKGKKPNKWFWPWRSKRSPRIAKTSHTALLWGVEEIEK